jgi:ribosome-associated protein
MQAPDRTEQPLQGSELAHHLVDVLVDRQAADVVMLDLTALSAFTDYFVIATADNERQLGALIEAVEHSLAEVAPELNLRQEGSPEGGWVLLDLGAVIVHLFSLEQRARYDLEGLWRRAQEVVRVQ